MWVGQTLLYGHTVRALARGRRLPTVSVSEHQPCLFPICSPILYRTPVSTNPMKLSKKAIEEGLDSIPLSHILGKQVSDGLTTKQRKFAREVAKGSTKADAYRAAYDVTSQRTLNVEPYMLARDPRIAKEIEAYTLALESAKHRTPAALRELVIQGLVQVALNPDAKDAVKVQALKTIGTITEVAAFTERKEVRTISSSEDARAKVMQELRGLITSGATDATVIDADSLMAELAGETVNINAGGVGLDVPVNINADLEGQEGSAEPEAQTPPHPDPPAA